LGTLLAAPLTAQEGLRLTPTMIVRPRSEVRLPLRLGGIGLPVDLAPILGVREDSLRRTPRGVFYDDVLLGGGELVRPGDSVAVHFVGYLADGLPVTKSQKEPFRFRLGSGNVVEGWEDGLPGMRVGGRRMLVIPAPLGYGAKGSGPIPPNATLVFDVMVVERK
jgi:peptidylprolyl isomerase